MWKDFMMEIRTSLNRFLSIFIIVALGVAFFAGLRAANPDMRLTADYYYDSSELMDIRILGTLGLTKEDVTAISEVDGVEQVEPAYSTHVLCNASNSELVLEVMSLTQNLNQYTVTEGRLPRKQNEVLVDTHFIDGTGLNIGNTLQVTSGTDKALSDTLHQEKFTIVGIGRTPYYLSFQRGNSNIGNGKVNSFIVVTPDTFATKAYTTVYVSVHGAKNMTVYTQEYDDQVDKVLQSIIKDC